MFQIYANLDLRGHSEDSFEAKILIIVLSYMYGECTDDVVVM